MKSLLMLSGAECKLTGKEEALLIATACSKPPLGRARWTLELLAGEIVKLTEHEELSRETVRRRLAENDLKHWPRIGGTFPKNGESDPPMSSRRRDASRSPGRCATRSSQKKKATVMLGTQAGSTWSKSRRDRRPAIEIRSL
jgi:hypothetical protein